ncbi:MAG: hypothetical protein H6577_07295 [Lewinellaceae bacterium]|nr:hypothetical protein [Saprospiraceae bacterium]MCB9337916.1 hypothetical protein [Lewinellaceae bacterium]
MKKLFFGIIAWAALSFCANAQPGPDQLPPRAQEKIEAYKIAFFTEKLQLTPDESKDFWPLYNQYDDEMESLKNKYNLDGKRVELMSDKEVEDFINQHLNAEEQRVKLQRDYVERFKKILPIRKVAMLQRLDREFKMALLDEIKKRREARQGGAPGTRKNRGN